MSVVLHKDIEASKLHAPRVDGQSIVLEAGAGGEAQQARINATAMSDDSMVYWDAGNDRLATTGVSITELAVLDGVTPGIAQASKAVVLDSSRDLDSATAGNQIRNLRLAGTLHVASSVTLNGNVVTNGTVLHMGSHVSVQQDIEVLGHVVSDLSMANGDQRLRSFFGGGYRDMVSHSMGYNLVRLGNANDDIMTYGEIYFGGSESSPTNKAWHAGNDGVGSGLHADLLDGQHGPYYVALGNATGNLPFSQVEGVSGITDPTKGPKIWHRNDDERYKAFMRPVVISREVNGVFQYSDPFDEFDDMSTWYAVRVNGCAVNTRQAGGTVYGSFDTGGTYNLSDQWFNLTADMAIYWQNPSGRPLVQIGATCDHVAIAMTIYCVGRTTP